MINNQIFIENVYAHDDAIFQVGENGSKTKFDPITRRRYGYASGDNIKHCVKDKFSELTGFVEGKATFVRNAKTSKSSSDTKEQGEVYIDINLLNPFHRIWGGFNPISETIKNEVYSKTALKSIVELSSNQPLHTLLTTTSKDCGVKKGKYTDDIIFKDNASYYTIEELMSETGLKKNELLKNSSKSNFLMGNDTSKGIYKYNYVINVNGFKYCDISEYDLTDDMINSLKEKGYDVQTIDNKRMLVVPTDEAINLFESVVDSLFLWDYTANNSTHYNLREFLRCTFGVNNPSYVPMSIMGVLSNDGDTVNIETLSDEEVSKCGIYAFTSKNLKKYHNVDDVTYDVFAEKNAIEKIKQLGIEIIKNI